MSYLAWLGYLKSMVCVYLYEYVCWLVHACVYVLCVFMCRYACSISILGKIVSWIKIGLVITFSSLFLLSLVPFWPNILLFF